MLISKNEVFHLALMNDNIGIISCDYVYSININYEGVQKEDIYIKAERLLEKVIEVGSLLSFETNVSDIPNLIIDSK